MMHICVQIVLSTCFVLGVLLSRFHTEEVVDIYGQKHGCIREESCARESVVRGKRVEPGNRVVQGIVLY